MPILTIIVAHVLASSRRPELNCAMILTLLALAMPIARFLFSGGPGLIPWLLAMGGSMLLSLLANYVYIYLLRKVQDNMPVYVVVLILFPLLAGNVIRL